MYTIDVWNNGVTAEKFSIYMIYLQYLLEE